MALFAAALRARGLLTPAFRARWGLSEDGTQIALVHVAEFTAACATLAKDPILGATLGFGLPRGAYGVVEFLWRSAPTFGAAIEAAARFAPLISEVMHLRAQPLGDRLRVAYPRPADSEPLGRQGNLFVIAFAARLVHDLSAGALRPLAFGVAHCEAEPAASRMLGAEVRPGQIENWIELPRASASVPVASSDSALFAALVAFLGRLERTHGKPRTLRAQLEREIELRLSGGSVRLGALAAALHLRPHVLQRKLATEGLRLARLVDDVRRARAASLLPDLRLSLDDVAYQLGFSELSAFVRAYRRWTGATPGAARRGASR